MSHPLNAGQRRYAPRGAQCGNSGARAFTLMEVMLAIALILVLSGAVYGFLWNLLGQRERVAVAVADSQAAGVIIERLEADLMGAVASGRGGAGIVGDGSSLKVLSRCVTVPMAAGARLGDLAGSEIAFNRFTGVVRARRIGPDGTAAEWEDVSDHVQRLRLRYFDGRRWRATFDSAAGAELPAAIEVALWFGEPLERAETEEELAAAGAGPPPSGAGADGAEEAVPHVVPTWAPDRVRVIVVPDGPSAGWRESR